MAALIKATTKVLKVLPKPIRKIITAKKKIRFWHGKFFKCPIFKKRIFISRSGQKQKHMAKRNFQ